MTENPYAPPTAPVADVSSQPRPTEVHGNVVMACKLLWGSFGVSMVALVLQLFLVPMGGSFLGALFGGAIVAAIVLGITYWFVLKLTAGRNWMRWLVTILTGIWVVTLPFNFGNYQVAFAGRVPQLMVQAIASAIQLIVSVIIVVLINMPGARAWFQAMRGAD